MVGAARGSNWRVAVTIAMLLVPTVFSIVLRFLWHNVPPRIPTHWGASGPANGFSDSTTTWIICLLIVIAAGAAGIGVIEFGREILPLRRSVAVGVCAAISSLAAVAWPVFTLSAIAAGGLKGDQNNTFVLFLAGFVWGGLVLLSAGPFVGLGSQFTRSAAISR